MERTLAERLQDCAHGLSLGADGMGWSPDPALLREAAEEVERLRAQNARLGREAHTWWTACRDATGEIERLRGVLLKIEAGEYLHLPTMVRDALGPNGLLSRARDGA